MIEREHVSTRSVTGCHTPIKSFIDRGKISFQLISGRALLSPYDAHFFRVGAYSTSKIKRISSWSILLSFKSRQRME